MNKTSFSLKDDTNSEDNFCSKYYWIKLGRPPLQPTRCRYISVTRQELPVLTDSSRTADIYINVTSLPDLSLLGHAAVKKLHIDIKRLLNSETPATNAHTIQQQGGMQRTVGSTPRTVPTRIRMSKRLESKNAFKQDAMPTGKTLGNLILDIVHYRTFSVHTNIIIVFNENFQSFPYI